MKSIIDTELTVIKGTITFKAKDYLDWYGIPNIGFIWKGTQADPYIEYKDKQFNSHIVEDTMWERYCEDCEELGIEANEDKFADYMLHYKDYVYELCELAVDGMEE